MVIFSLVGGKSFVAAFVAACIRSVASMAEQMTRELGTLLEVFGGSLTRIPLAETVCTIIYVHRFNVFVEGFRGIEDGEA